VKKGPVLKKGAPPGGNLASLPEDAPDAIVTIYSLPARMERLQEFCNQYLNALELPDNVRFDPISAELYLIVRSNNEGEPREVAFSIPVVRREGEEPKEEMLVSPFIFSETDVEAIIDRELNGRPTVDATLLPQNREEAGFNAEKPDLVLKTEAVEEPDINRPATDKTILQITHENQPQEEEVPKDVVEPILARVLRHVMLKQVRDADDPNRACYQALVLFSENIQAQRISDPNAATVRITQYSNSPIVRTLGLHPEEHEARDRQGRPVKVAELRPRWSFSMRVNIEQEVARTVYWRAGAGNWKREGG
jgi:hypothetical protein